MMKDRIQTNRSRLRQLALLLLVTAQPLVFADIKFASEPMAIITGGAPPNVMLLLDDSTSMSCYSGGCGDDVSYAPGYDSEKRYACAETMTVLEPVSSATLVLKISNNTGFQGTPYFSYNGSDYGWGTLSAAVASTSPEVFGDSNRSRVCFNPDKNYSVKLKADKESLTVISPEQPSVRLVKKDNYYCRNTSYPYNIHPTHTSKYFSGTIKVQGVNYTKKNVCNSSASDSYQRYFATKATSDIWSDYVPAVTSLNYLYSNETTRTETGNYLNWYFSATVAEWADNSDDGGYKDYGTTPPNRGYWTEEVASNFIRVSTIFNGGNPAATVINGTTTNSNSKTWFPNSTPPQTDWTDHKNGSTHDSGEHDMLGMKPGVHNYQFRYLVSKDVAKMLVRKLNHAKVGVAAMHTPVAVDYTYPTDSVMNNQYSKNGGSLVHGLVELDDVTEGDDVKEQTSDYRESLAKSIHAIRSCGGTPTAESMTGIANYFFQGYEDESSPIGGTGKKLSDSLPSSMLHNVVGPYVDRDTPNITEAGWCAKNVMVVLTDGEPTNDSSYPSYFKSYYPEGLPNPSSPALTTDVNDSGIVRVPGALYDKDWISSIPGKQNIETFFVAMGDSATINAPVFDHAGMAGGGGTNNSYAANNGAELLNAFNSIIQKIQAASASITAVAISSVAELKAENSAFQATYDTEFWSGHIKAFNINSSGYFTNPDGTGASETSKNVTHKWEASDRLSAMYILNDRNLSGVDVGKNYVTGGVKSRKIFTWGGSDGIQFGSSTMTRPSTAAGTFAPFNALPANMRSDLDVVANGDSRERYDLMMFLMGDILNQKNYPLSGGLAKYRQRGSYTDKDADGLLDSVGAGGILGDIVTSSPVYVGAPPRPWDDANYGETGKRYSDFKKAQNARPQMVYVGANDGMVHGFTVSGGSKGGITYPAGAELFAYMPSMLASTTNDQGFHYLADTNYQHRYYVDLTLTPSDVFMDFYTNTGTMSPEWRTVLVGGLQAGGKGYFALDVTCPFQTTTAPGNTCDNESFGAGNILWEFDSTDDEDLGFTFSKAVVAKVNYDAGYDADDERNGNGNGRWAAIVGNGYNSKNGRAALFIIFLDGGIDGTWTEGEDYLKIYVGDEDDDTEDAKNGLSSPQPMDINRDGLMDRVYAGDLKGHMWSIDISSHYTKSSFGSGTTPWVVNKLFTTGSKEGVTQPITTAPMVARDGAVSAASPNLMVVFATGKFMEISDLQDASMQSVYAVHDRGVYNLTRYDKTFDDKDMLVPRIFTQEEVTVGDITRKNRIMTGEKVDLYSQFGWYADLASDVNEDGSLGGIEVKGERVVYDPFIANKLFVFNSLIPVVASCAGSTEGWTMLIDWTTGLAPTFAAYDANLNGSLDTLDVGFAGWSDDETGSGSQLGRAGDNLYFSIGEDAYRQGTDFGSSGGGKRLGWEERFPFGVIK